MTDKETARDQVAAIVERFRNTPKRTREGYNEGQTRYTFILPLFRALGWSTEDPMAFSVEEQISHGFVDFGFYLNGVTSFYLETKRVREDISKPEHMKQAINYAYLKGVTWAVLSDFEETMVFNAEWEERDPEQARFLTLRWEDYAGKDFDDLWLLSKSSMLAREIDEKAERYGRKRRKEPVTDKLFKQLTEWRRELFSVIQTYNQDKLWAQNPHEVDNAVQKFIDRLIFIRTAEDREIEPNRLNALLRQSKTGNVWKNLLALFRELDAVYNSNLFAESSLDWMDVYDPDLIKEIIDGLYTLPGSYFRYDFNAITADVLGAVYEQYLGFKALDPEGKTSLGGKQQKRKAQGIYYTPQFVVRYIVQNTVGKLLQEGADGHKLRILDPACGSGSFLIEAFDVLDRWLAQQEPNVPASERRRRILMENLYGVDLDDQAVEVTRLNLLLRASLERGKLPLLTHIQNGNSLIDDPAVAGDMAFKWDERFAEVMRGGGFDVVIGNPPYIRIQSLPHEQVAWMNDTYESATANYDIYIPFVERGLGVLNPEGLLGYILPHKFLNAQYGKNLRQLIGRGKHLTEIVHFGDQQVFTGATTYTCILVLSKAPQDNFHFTKVNSLSTWLTATKKSPESIKAMKADESEWNFSVGVVSNLYEKLYGLPTKLGNIAEIFVGLQTSADTVYLFKDKRKSAHRLTSVYSNALGATVQLESDLLKPVVRSGKIGRYWAEDTALVLFPYSLSSGKAEIIPPQIMQRDYPMTWSYLLANETLLREREKGKFDGEYWYQLYPKNLNLWERRKILVPYMITRLSGHLDTSNTYFVNVTTGGFGLQIASSYGSLEYFTGLLNSSLLDFFMKLVSTNFHGGYFAANKQFLVQLPIRTVNFDDPADKARHDRMVQMVEQMMALKQEQTQLEANLSDKRHEITQRIERLDRDIDALVYELYGLTDEEIAIVEGQHG